MNNGQLAAVILAAGSSSRMGGAKKEYQRLKTGATVLENAVCAFAALSSIKIIVIAVPENEEAITRESLPSELFEGIGELKILFVTGGRTRRASVFNALLLLKSINPEYVLIHDGARPWVSCSLIENIVVAVKKHGAVIPLVPLSDTPKELESGEDTEQSGIFIKKHLKRANIGVAQTPQAFRFPEILYAHEKAADVNEEFTDDAEIWDRFCGQVAVIPGDPQNRKITFPEDLF
jgi:2-C-methyl-D-erythritol 4-phosphate cytidylyltransferase